MPSPIARTGHAMSHVEFKLHLISPHVNYLYPSSTSMKTLGRDSTSLPGEVGLDESIRPHSTAPDSDQPERARRDHDSLLLCARSRSAFCPFNVGHNSTFITDGVRVGGVPGSHPTFFARWPLFFSCCRSIREIPSWKSDGG